MATHSSGLENPMDRGAWWVTVHGVTRDTHDFATKPPPPPTCGVEHLFMCLFDIINIFFGQVPLQIFCSFEKNKPGCLSSCYCVMRVLYVFWTEVSSIRHEFYKYFLSDLHICFLMIFFEEWKFQIWWSPIYWFFSFLIQAYLL